MSSASNIKFSATSIVWKKKINFFKFHPKVGFCFHRLIYVHDGIKNGDTEYIIRRLLMCLW